MRPSLTAYLLENSLGASSLGGIDETNTLDRLEEFPTPVEPEEASVQTGPPPAKSRVEVVHRQVLPSQPVTWKLKQPCTNFLFFLRHTVVRVAESGAPYFITREDDLNTRFMHLLKRTWSLVHLLAGSCFTWQGG